MENFAKKIQHKGLLNWIEEIRELSSPDACYLCDGSLSEYQRICQELVRLGTFIPLNETKRPGSFLCRSDPEDVARVEGSTFICSAREEDAGPTNHWKNPREMEQLLQELFRGCMQGRTMYILPFSMGPLSSSLSLLGVQITDSPYVVANMFLMTRMGDVALRLLRDGVSFIPCLHSVGVPLKPGEKPSTWPCQLDHRYIVHFPEKKKIVSFGSGYGGNALLGKKCLALRVASVQAKEEKWLAEHMLIIGVTSPEGDKKYFVAAFPSACGKTNLAMLESTLPGWKVECVGDDIAWMRIGSDGRLYAINPEAGFFGVAPGTSRASNPHVMETLSKNAIFTNVALTPDGDVWWEGKTKKPPPKLTDWMGNPWTPSSKRVAAHPNARFTVSAFQCPVLDSAFDEEKGVPISGIIFGGRRENTVPLVIESFSWQHGTFFGASLSSETTAAATGMVGKLRHDPFAMLPFCGYHMGDYFAHWLEMGELLGKKAPKIFYVNWFRKSKEGKFLWPGFGENIRVLKWIFSRCLEEEKMARKTPLGYLPTEGSLDLSGLSITSQEMVDLLAVDTPLWKKEIRNLQEYFAQFAPKLPRGLEEELSHLGDRLDRM